MQAVSANKTIGVDIAEFLEAGRHTMRGPLNTEARAAKVQVFGAERLGQNLLQRRAMQHEADFADEPLQFVFGRRHDDAPVPATERGAACKAH